MIKVKFVLNRFGWDPAKNEPPIESVSIIKEIDAGLLPNQGDVVPVARPAWPKPIVRLRTSYALAESQYGVAWVIQMKCDDTRLFAHLRENGWH